MTITIENNIVFRPKDILELIQIERKIRRIYENQCNGIEYKGMDTKLHNLQNDARYIITAYPYELEFQPDPRGSSLIIKYQTMEYRV